MRGSPALNFEWTIPQYSSPHFAFFNRLEYEVAFVSTSDTRSTGRTGLDWSASKLFLGHIPLYVYDSNDEPLLDNLFPM